jgi:hypothetical protein
MISVYFSIFGIEQLIISSKRLLFKERIANCVGVPIDCHSRIMISVVDIAV